MVRPAFPNVPPRFSPDNGEEVRESTVSFGDGYDLTVGDGLNNIRAEKQLHWEPVSYEQMAQMLSFVRSRAGDWFYYHTDEDTNRGRKMKCTSWNWGRVKDTENLWYFKASFKEIFRNEV